MAKKGIDLRCINEHCANEKMMKAVASQGLEANAGEISLVKMVLKYRHIRKNDGSAHESRKQADHKRSRNTPFYAFYKPVGKSKAVFFRIDTGEVRIVSVAYISDRNEVKGTFKINGVTYGPKDTVNGLRRFGQYK